MSALMDQSNMDGILTSANILLHNSASQHILRVNYWKLGEHDKLDMFEPVWFVQHVNVDSDDVDLDD